MSAALEGLDPDQRRAAEALVGPVCILAGAGTGKTRAITHRIAHGVATGAYSPTRVMALTFTARAAAELRTRLRSLGAGGVPARTFHAAALSQLGYFWPRVVGGPAPALLDSKARLLAQAAESLGMRVDTAVLRDVAGEIEWRKVSDMSMARYETVAPSRGLTLPTESVVALQTRYEELKDARRSLDFEDVLLATAGMIENEPSVALEVREQYRFFVVDEYQDVSPAQQRLLRLWLGGRRDVCVVGDSSQTIYSFAGARADYLLDFPRTYDDATVVRLERNYRSTPEIVASANRLMRGRPGALALHAQSPSVRRGETVVLPFASDAAEARGVAEAVRAEISSGTRPRDIAILYRVNGQSAALESALSAVDVPTQVRGAARYFERPEVRQALLALRAAALTVTDEPLFKSVSDVLRSLGWTANASEARGSVRERWDSLNALVGLVDAAPPGTGLRAFTDDLLHRQSTGHEPDREAVTLATLHSAKGLEWDVVHIVGLSEGLLPISYASGIEQVDEERRLLYVGITRARRRLSLSWSAAGQQGGSRRRQPSRFLQELDTRRAGAGRGVVR